MARESNLFQILRAIPPKWAIGVIVALLVYWLVQPTINRSFGTNLPSLTSIVTGEPDPQPKVATNDSKQQTASKKSTSSNKKVDGEEAKAGSKESPPPKPKVAGKKKADESKSKDPPGFGYLEEVGRDRFQSPSGLMYVPGGAKAIV